MSGRATRIPIPCAILLVAAALLLPAAPAADASPTPLKDAYLKRFLGQPAPPFSVKDMAGRPVSLSAYRGKVVLLNFWYSACFPCRQETPDLIALYKAHKDRGLVIRKFVETYEIPSPVLIADRKMYDDYGRIPIAPVTHLIDREGKIARIFWGAFPGPAYESALKPYLEAARP